MKVLIITIIVIGMAVVIFAMFKSGNFIKNLFRTVIQGIASLLAVNTIGLLTGVTIALNWYTLTAISVFGAPACIALLLTDILFR